MTLLAVESIEFLERGTFLQALEAPAGTVIDNDESYLFLHAWSGGGAALEIIQIRVYYLA